MQILYIIGLVAIAAAVGLVMLRDKDDNNAGVTGFLSKLKSFAEGGDASKAHADKYEKSDDGKVVYAFKQKGVGSAEEAAGEEAEAEASEGDNPSDEDA